MNTFGSNVTQYEVTDDGFEAEQNVRKIKTSDPDGRRHMLSSTAEINKLVRYAQMMDELHLARVRARKGSGIRYVVNKSQNHTIIFIGLIRIYQAVGAKFTVTQKYLAERYAIDRGTVKKVLDDFILNGFITEDYVPTDFLIERYQEFVELFCKNSATENFCRSVAYGLMLRAAPDNQEFENTLKEDVGLSA